MRIGVQSQQVIQPRINIEGPRLTIDQSAPRAELGMGDYRDLAAAQVQEARATAHQGIARRAQEGRRFAQEMKSQNTAARLARERSLADIPRLGFDVLPKSRPQIEFYYELEISWPPGPYNNQPKGTYIDTMG